VVHHLPPAAFPCQPSPSPCIHIFLSPFNLSPVHMHVCRQGDISRFFFSLMSSFDRPAFRLPCASASLFPSPFLPAFCFTSKQADVWLPSLLPHSYRTLSAAPASRERLAPSTRIRRVAPLRLRHKQNQTSRHLDTQTPTSLSFFRPPHSCLSIPTLLRSLSAPLHRACLLPSLSSPSFF
jgi:hypothetical protein